MRSYGAAMTRCAKYAGAALLLGVVASCGQAQPLSGADCRSAWERLRQTQAENGSIAPEGTATAARWQEEYDAAARHAKRPDDLDTCTQDVADAADRFSALVDLGAAVNRFDLLVQLRQAERDLRHARRTRGYSPLPRPLAEAFLDLRGAAPPVHEAVADAESRATSLDLDDRDAVRRLADDVEGAATRHPSYDKGRRALEVIGRYELDEE